MLSPKEVADALTILKANKGLNQLCYQMDWRDLSPLSEAIKLRLVQADLGHAEDLIHAYAIQDRVGASSFPDRDRNAALNQRDRQANGLVNLCSKCTDDFIIYYAFPTTQVTSRPTSKF